MKKNVSKQSLYMALRAKVEASPNDIAFVLMDKSFSYMHLHSRIKQFAFALKENGVKKDDVVTISLNYIPDAIYLLYAINQLGAITNIVSPTVSYEEMKDILRKNKSSHLFSMDAKIQEFQRFVFDGIDVHFCSPVSELPLRKRLSYKSTSRKYGKIPPEYTMLGFYNAPEYEKFDEGCNDSVLIQSKDKTETISMSKLNSLVKQETQVETLANDTMFDNLDILTKIHSALISGVNSK